MEPKFTPRDVIVFAFRDKYPDRWADADDFADVLMAGFVLHGYGINPT